MRLHIQDVHPIDLSSPQTNFLMTTRCIDPQCETHHYAESGLFISPRRLAFVSLDRKLFGAVRGDEGAAIPCGEVNVHP